MALHADAVVRRAAWLSLATALLIGSSVTPARAQAAGQALDVAVTAAAAAVREAFGGDAEVVITRPVLQLTPGAGPILRAVPEPSSRTAGPVRFVLHGAADGTRSTRVGRLTADVRVRAPHVRVTAPMASRATLDAASLAATLDDVGRQPLVALPTLDDVVGATARKPLPEGAVVTRAALLARPLVSTGDEVVTVARIGALEVRGRAIAAQAGSLGETVVVVNPDSRKRLQGRVVAEALVEVGHGS